MSRKAFPLAVFFSLILALTTAIVPQQVVRAANITAVASGAWNAPGTWNCACVPSSSDNLTIPSGFTVDITGYVNNGSILNNGTLTNTNFFLNIGTLTNNGVVINSGTSIANPGVIDNAGVINSIGLAFIANVGVINTGCPGSITGAVFTNRPIYNCPGQINNPPPDDRLNWKHGDDFAAIYSRFDQQGNPDIVIYCIAPDASGVLAMTITQSDLVGVPMPPATNMLVKNRTMCHIRFYVLTTGEYQINTGPNKEGKVFVAIFTDLTGKGIYFKDFTVPTTG